ncbi:MAG: amidophosphoribosyltransferase [Nitrososphaerales archaeon]
MLIKEKCGLAAASSQKEANVLPLIVNMLRALQHRGQEAWGLAVPGKEPWRMLGLVSESLGKAAAICARSPSPYAIGHTRYSTVGRTVLENVQPMMVGREFAIAHNGTISNTEEIVSRLSRYYDVPTWASDTLIVGYRIHYLLSKFNGDWFKVFEELAPELNGAYCFTILTKAGEVYAARDERGFRPLCLGWHDETSSYVVASESCALSVIGAQLIRDVKPGEIIRIKRGIIETHMFAESERPAHCAFEYTYFANPSSTLDGVSVYEARKRLGQELARLYKIEADIVIPVPDSARPAALGFSQVSGIPLEEGLMKDRYSKKGGLRSFIEPALKDRLEINRWVLPVEQTVRGKRVVLIDDSIVRGTSSRTIIKALRKAGAKSISLLSTYPPIRYPCFAGIDFPTKEELVAHKIGSDVEDLAEINKRVAEEVGADFVGYNTLEGLAKGICKPLTDLCTSCHTGNYSCLKKTPQYTQRMKKGRW